MTNEALIQKGVMMRELFLSVDFPPTMLRFFVLDSDKFLDEKIKVLTALKEGHSISEIPNFYDILELYPQNEEKDRIITDIHWD